jgi:hypothetical protein
MWIGFDEEIKRKHRRGTFNEKSDFDIISVEIDSSEEAKSLDDPMPQI